MALSAIALGLSLTSTTASGVSAGARETPAIQASGCNPNGQARFEASHRLPPARLAGYVRTYCDDFRGPRLIHGWFLFRGQPGGDPGAMFAPSHVVQTGGLLVIKTYRDRANGGRWATGGVCECRIAQTYGAYFVRSRVTGAGDDNDELLWPYGHGWPPEIDFNETSPTTSRTGSYVHYSAANRQIAHQLSINLTSWHTWGLIWTPRSVTFTVDGHVWGRVTDPSAIPRVRMTLDIQEQTYCYNGTACPTRPVSLQVDWVTEFAHR